MGDLLSKIYSPQDLKKLNPQDLHKLAVELRQFIINIVSENGGHFGASLGVVELTIAIHYVFNTPKDLLVWDVGHQAYGHKILTGRQKKFFTNRKWKGISGFPKRAESIYDTFGVGHSSTSISAALGMSVASKILNKKKHHIAVIGDGAMTAGLAFEGLNHAGIENSNILVVLNDNCMSIDPNVGALKEYLLKISTSKIYNDTKKEIWSLLGKLSKFGSSAKDIVRRTEKAIKSSLLKNSNLFESLNFRYFGPIDGHDIDNLVQTLENLKKIPGPKILHCITTKGKGYEIAENNQTKWHAPGIFDKDTGVITESKNLNEPKKYQDVFGKTIIELAKKNKNIVGITPAMPSGSSLKFMMEKIPSRAFDVGIAEQHAVTFSAGLSTEGIIPFCNIYSTFLQRAYDQVIHDVAIQKLHVVFCIDRGGLVGADGETHQGVFDIAFLRCIPNLIISSPINEEELRNLMYTAQSKKFGPFCIRYPRGKGIMKNSNTTFKKIKIGTGKELLKGNHIACITFGPIGNDVYDIAKNLHKKNVQVGVYNLRFVKPLDEVLLHKIFSSYECIITVEDGCVQGGMGSAILEFGAKNKYQKTFETLGVPDKFIPHGSQNEQKKECGIDKKSISKIIEKNFKKFNT